jgi:hypothetical protein
MKGRKLVETPPIEESIHEYKRWTPPSTPPTSTGKVTSDRSDCTTVIPVRGNFGDAFKRMLSVRRRAEEGVPAVFPTLDLPAKELTTPKTIEALRVLGFSTYTEAIRHALGNRDYIGMMLPEPRSPTEAWMERVLQHKKSLRRILRLNASTIGYHDVVLKLRQLTASILRVQSGLDSTSINQMDQDRHRMRMDSRHPVGVGGIDFPHYEAIYRLSSLTDIVHVRRCIYHRSLAVRIESQIYLEGRLGVHLSPKGIQKFLATILERFGARGDSFLICMCTPAVPRGTIPADSGRGECESCAQSIDWHANTPTPYLVHPQCACALTTALLASGCFREGSKIIFPVDPKYRVSL